MRLGVRPKADLKRVRVDARVSLPFTNHRIPMRRELIDDKSEPWTDFERMLDTNVGDAISFIHRRIFRRRDFSRSYWGRLYLILMIDWIRQLNASRVLLRYFSSNRWMLNDRIYISDWSENFFSCLFFEWEEVNCFSLHVYQLVFNVIFIISCDYFLTRDSFVLLLLNFSFLLLKYSSTILESNGTLNTD